MTAEADWRREEQARAEKKERSEDAAHERLDVAVDDAFLVRVLDRLADGNEQFQSLVRREMFLVAIPGHRDPVDQFHNKVGAAGFRGSGIEGRAMLG